MTFRVNRSQFILGIDRYDSPRAGPLRAFQFPILSILFRGKPLANHNLKGGTFIQQRQKEEA